MLIAPFPLVVLIIGLLMWALAKTNALVQRVGEIMFFCGLLALCFAASKNTIHLFGI